MTQVSLVWAVLRLQPMESLFLHAVHYKGGVQTMSSTTLIFTYLVPHPTEKEENYQLVDCMHV